MTLQTDWISCDTALPPKPMVVKWQYNDLSEDVGYWDGKDFRTYDVRRQLPIINWKPNTK